MIRKNRTYAPLRIRLITLAFTLPATLTGLLVASSSPAAAAICEEYSWVDRQSIKPTSGWEFFEDAGIAVNIGPNTPAGVHHIKSEVTNGHTTTLNGEVGAKVGIAKVLAEVHAKFNYTWQQSASTVIGYSVDQTVSQQPYEQVLRMGYAQRSWEFDYYRQSTACRPLYHEHKIIYEYKFRVAVFEEKALPQLISQQTIINEPLPPAPEPVPQRRYADVIGRNTIGSGDLWSYLNQHNNTLGKPLYQGYGWGTYNWLGYGDVNGDGRPDMVGRNNSGSGELYVYYGTADGTLGGAAYVGYGWNTYTWLGVADIDGDAKADMVGRNAKGELYVYYSDGSGFGPAKYSGYGWNTYNKLMAADLDGDGHGDMIGRNNAGELWWYPGDGEGGFGSARGLGYGWNTYNWLGTGDMDGDGKADVFGRNNSGSGELYWYPSNGSSLGSARYLGYGWNTYNWLAVA